MSFCLLSCGIHMILCVLERDKDGVGVHLQKYKVQNTNTLTKSHKEKGAHRSLRQERRRAVRQRRTEPNNETLRIARDCCSLRSASNSLRMRQVGGTTTPSPPISQLIRAFGHCSCVRSYLLQYYILICRNMAMTCETTRLIEYQSNNIKHAPVLRGEVEFLSTLAMTHQHPAQGLSPALMLLF